MRFDFTMPNPIFADGSYTLSGSYFSVSNGNGIIKSGDPEENVNATIEGFKITFPSHNSVGTIIRWDYDYSWGNPDIGIVILGDTKGAYHVIILGEKDFDWSKLDIKYTGQGQTTGKNNFFTVTYNGRNYDFVQDDTGTAPVSFTPCYLAGSLISTPNGPRKIEDISPGDYVYTYNGGIEAESRVEWVGVASVRTTPNMQEDVSGYPVVIKKDAISANVPYADLSVTSEHCIVLDGKFSPIRMLVNGSSIFYDRTNTRFLVYHLMTAQHSIINVNGILSETYLYNKSSIWKFNTQKGKNPHAEKSLSWENDSAAPLCCAREFVEPIWRKISARIKPNSVNPAKPNYVVSTDPNLRLIVGGKTVHPIRQKDSWYIFSITDSNDVWIESRHSRPADVEGNFVDDRRELGVLVSGITLYHPLIDKTGPIDFFDRNLQGWHEASEGNVRWTSGHAYLRLPEGVDSEHALIKIDLAGTAKYLDPAAT